MSHNDYVPCIIQSEDEMTNIEIDSSTQTVKDLKKIIKSKYKIPEYCQKIYFHESELLDNDQLGNKSLYLFDLNNLRLKIDIKDSKFEFFLKGSESISDLKQKISNKLNTPIPNHKMKIYNSDKIVDDNQLIEDFLPNLFFKTKLLETDKIKINLIKGNNLETIFVDPFSYIEDTPINKGYNYRIKFKDQFIYNRKLFCEYNIKNGDTIELIELKSKKINLSVKNRRRKTINVSVYPEDQIFILVDLLNIKNESKYAEICYDGEEYSIWSSLTFEEIGITEDMDEDESLLLFEDRYD